MVKSTTKDGSIVAQSSVDDLVANDAVTTPARISAQNSSVRPGSGQPAKPRSAPVPIAATASRTTDERREQIDISPDRAEQARIHMGRCGTSGYGRTF